MATTTQILFNSPALHSLKRDQLVKLCKIHSIKANGKNSELIERLKQRAQELPPDAALEEEEEVEDDAMEGVQRDAPEPDPTTEQQEHHLRQQHQQQGEDEQDDDMPRGMPVDPPADAQQNTIEPDQDFEMQDVVLTSRFSITRPSEQWEVVMEDIEEVEETMGTASSKDSLRTASNSNGEFGTHSSKSECSGFSSCVQSSVFEDQVVELVSVICFCLCVQRPLMEEVAGRAVNIISGRRHTTNQCSMCLAWHFSCGFVPSF